MRAARCLRDGDHSEFDRPGSGRPGSPLRWALVALVVFLTAFPSAGSILVIAPHPDDDLITSAGVTYKAIQRGEPVRVVFMTNGDSVSIQNGNTRQDEATAAQVGHLGTSENNLMFLGYPDGYLDVLYANYTQPNSVFTSPATGQSTTYAHRGLGLTDYHHYRFGASANYNRANMLADLKDILSSYQPTHILVTSGTDGHLDHSTTYQLLLLALADVFVDHPNYNPTVHKTNVWTSCGPNPIDPTAYFLVVPCDAGGTWSERESLDVTLPMQSTFYPGNIKYQAIGEHVSSRGDTGFLANYVHKDEFFFVEQERGTNRPPVVAAGFDQTVPEGSFVTLDGSGSFDLNGDPLTYQWRQVAGPTVTLAGATSAHPTFNAPTGQGQNVTLAFELVVSDGSLGTLPDQVNVTVTSPLQRQLGNNIAGQASVQASSETPGSEAIKVIDGYAEGFPGDSTREWASNGQGAGAWIRLTWPSPVTIGRIVLFDRPNVNDFVVHGVLNFGDGSSVAVGPLDNWGRDSGYDFSTRTVTSVRFDIDQVGPNTSNVGLSEIKVYEVILPGGNHAPVANAGPDQTVNEGVGVTLDGSASHDQDSDSLTYSWAQTAGTPVTLSSTTAIQPTFAAPTGLVLNDVLTFRLTVNDGHLDGAPDFVNVNVNAAHPQNVSNIAPLATPTASSENSGTGQTAAKAVDGVIDGYPGDYTREWATNGEGAGAWLNLSWPSVYTVNRIVLYDRPNANDQITSGTIVFSDNSTLGVGPLVNAGTATPYDFGFRSITSLRLNVTGVSASTGNVGLSEIQVFGFAGYPNRPPVANAGPDQSVAEAAAVVLDGTGSSDPDGDSFSYHWSQTGGATVVLSGSTSAHPTFQAPQGLAANAQLTFRLIVNDGTLDSPPDTVVVTVQARDDDGDGVPNVVDNCPSVANANQQDTVGNGVGDACRCLTVTCTASDQCHVAGVCAPTTGACSNPAKANGSACNDGNACTLSDTCQSGACVGANPVVCTASDQCHAAGVCNTTTGTCSNPTKSNGSACNDGNACTLSDTCQAGACVGANPVVCTASDQCHVAGTCDTASGACSNPTKANGSACNDGNACTLSDTCQAGACVGANPVVCTASDQCHVAGVCNTTTGACSNPTKANGSACNDGNACTLSDTCQAGACVGAGPVICVASDQCHDPGVCDTATGTCSHPAKTDGSACSDGNGCTHSDTCQSGACISGLPVTCTAPDACHDTGVCNTATGGCFYPAKPNGAACSDGNACTLSDTCQSGACVGVNPVVCTASDQCHLAGSCDAATGACSNPAKADGSACNDANACTLSDTCQSGSCTGANPVTCVASDACHVAGTCDPATGACSSPTATDGTSCNDGSACTQTDACQNGVCVGANPVACTASDVCHVAGTCDPATGACSNPSACTAADACHLAGTCDPETGICSNPESPNGSACSDGDACTQNDSCQNGACVAGSPVTCAPPDACRQAGACNPATGICSNPPQPDGSSCDDGNACTQSDSCLGGTCTGSNPVTCNASDACHVGVCDTATGACTDQARPNGSSCTDGDACTLNDSCQNGACIGGSPVSCSPSDPCHLAGVCDTGTGACSNPAKPDGTNCNDGNACTPTDTCQNGACVGAPPIACDDGNPCTLDACDPSSGCTHVVLDADHDGTCDALDCAPLDPTAWAAPQEVAQAALAVIGPSLTRVTWSDSGQGFRYDVVVGLVRRLAQDGGVIDSSCVTNDLTAAHWDDTGPSPSAGEGFYYLVRARNSCGSSGYGFTSSSAPRVPGYSCP